MTVTTKLIFIVFILSASLSFSCQESQEAEPNQQSENLQAVNTKPKQERLYYVVEEQLMQEESVILFLARTLSKIDVRLLNASEATEDQSSSQDLALTAGFKKMSACMLLFTVCKQGDAFINGIGPRRPQVSSAPSPKVPDAPPGNIEQFKIFAEVIPKGGEITDQFSRSAFSSVLDAIDDNPTAFVRLNDDDISLYVSRFLKQEDPREIVTDFARQQVTNLAFGKGSLGSDIFSKLADNVEYFNNTYPKIAELVTKSLKDRNFKEFDRQLVEVLNEYDISPEEFAKQFSGRLITSFTKGQVFSHPVEAAASIAKASVAPKLAGVMHVAAEQADFLVKMSHHGLGLTQNPLNYVIVSFEEVNPQGNVLLTITDFDTSTQAYLPYKLVVNPHIILSSN